jgi:glycosyltransferase involved in cell wall biosynthesis
MRICFFAKGADADLLADAAYYSEDILILRELGHDLVIATRFAEIPWGCDLYFTWWYAWGFMSLSKSLIMGAPNIVVGPVHLWDPEFGLKKRSRLRRWSIRLSLFLADAAVAVSKTEYEGICALGARHPWMVYHSILAPSEIRPLAQRKRLVLSIGHLNWFGIKRKRFDNVIRAIPQVLHRFPDTRFVFLGRKGPGFGELLSLAAELNVQEAVDFPGRVTNQQKAEYLQSAQVVVQPTCYEGFGLAQLEAMANGVPVVTTPAGAVEEVVGECGLYCDNDNPDEMASHIVTLLENPALWASLSESSRQRAIDKFSRKERKRKLAEVVAHVTGRSDNPVRDAKYESEPARGSAIATRIEVRS